MDEADIIKTDGKYIYLLTRQGMLQIVEAKGGDMKLASSSGWSTAGEGNTGDVCRRGCVKCDNVPL